LNVEVFYLEDKPFLTKEENLVKEIGKRLKQVIEQEEAEQELRESEEKFHDLYEKAPYGSNKVIKL
jgi:GAF domain-containing protein